MLNINDYKNKPYWCLFKDNQNQSYYDGYSRLFITDLIDDEKYFIAQNSDDVLYLVPIQEIFETREKCEERISQIDQAKPIYFETDCGMIKEGIISEEDWCTGKYQIIWVYLKNKKMTKLEVKAR